jgi:hypothetical protein
MKPTVELLSRTNMNNHEKAYAILEQEGYTGVLAAATDGRLAVDVWTLCEPCENTTPHEDGACLVCGTPTPKVKP